MEPEMEPEIASGIASGIKPARNGARQRARLLARLHHDLRAPLARIVARARTTGLPHLAEVGQIASAQLVWLGDLHDCARYEVAAPELTPAPAYLHALLRGCGVQYDAATLPALAVLDARQLAQVLDRMRAQAGAPPVLALHVAPAAGAVTLAFMAGTPAGAAADASWTAVPASLDTDDIAPGLILAAHLVRAMGGCLQQAGAGTALRFAIDTALADEADAMPPMLFGTRFEPSSPFGDGHTILVLEPHDAMRDYLTEIFDSAGFTLCYDVAELEGARPALVVCAAEDDVREVQAPRMLHAQLPPDRPAEVAVVLYKPASPQQLLDAARRLLDDERFSRADGHP